jgi:hypothetical protein
MSTDRFLLAAVTDRLIFGSETTFDPADARTLLDAMPRRQAPRWEMGILGRLPGGSARGYSPGVGNTSVEEKERTFAFSTGQDAWARAGQWKLAWRKTRGGQTVEIQQVMAGPADDGRGARIHYAPDGAPVAMEIQTPRSFGMLYIEVVVPAWRPWKVPA